MTYNSKPELVRALHGKIKLIPDSVQRRFSVNTRDQFLSKKRDLRHKLKAVNSASQAQNLLWESCGHVAVDLSQFHCKLFMHWMQLILSRNKFIPIHACARAKSAVNSEPVPVTQKFAGDLQTFPCISADMRKVPKVKFFGPNTSV